VRVPHYEYDEGVVNKLGELIAHFENETAALVFDEVNNPGGSMFHMYAILSSLTDRALSLPKHELRLDDEDARTASEIVARVEAGQAEPDDSPELVAYSRFVLSEIQAGRGLGRQGNTKPGYLGGVTEILPAKNHYTKKIVVLINELDFSAAEFL